MALPKAGVELVADGLSGFVSDMGKANAAVANFGEAGSKSGSMFKSGFGEVVTGALRHIGTLAVDALGKAAQATGAFLKDSIGLAGDFQAGMLEFQSVAGKDVDTKGLDAFHDLFLQLGKELPVSTSEVQQAAIEMVKGGIDPAIVAAGGLRQNIQFAAAAMKGDLAGAATISAKILGGWSKAGATAAEQAEFLTHSTDLLTKAANASSVDVQELSLGIFNAQGIAKTAGVSFDDLTTTLAEIAPRFASSSEAGNSLKNVIARLQPTTKSATAAMEGLGLVTADGSNKFYDAQGNFIGFQKASQVLQESLVGLNNQQKQQVLQTIFGNDAMNAAATLAELGAKGYEDMAAKLDKANGVAAAAALIQGSFNTKLDNAKGSIETLKIILGEQLLPVLGDFLDNYITPGINAVTTFAEKLFDASDPVLFLAQKLSEVSPALSNIVFYLTDLVRHGEDVGGWLATTPALFQGFIGVVQTVGSVLGPVVDGIKEGFGDNGIAGAIDTVVFQLSQVSPAFAIVVGVIQAAIPTVQLIIDAFADMATRSEITTGTVITAFQTAHTLVNGAVSAILNTVQDVFGVIGKYIPDIMKSIEKIIGSVLDQIAIFWKNNGADIMAFVDKAWSSISQIITGIVEIIMILVSTFLAKVSEWFSKYHTEIQLVVQGAWDIISGIISGVLAIILGAVNTTLALLKGDFSGAWDAIVQMSKDFVLALDKVVGGLLEVMIGVGMDIVNGIKQGIADQWGKLVDWFSDKLAELTDMLPFSEPKDPYSPLRGLSKSGAAIVDMLQMGIDGAGGLRIGAPMIGGMGQIATPASASQILGAGMGNSTTNNYSRSISMPVTTNMTPSAIGQSLAIAGALLT